MNVTYDFNGKDRKDMSVFFKSFLITVSMGVCLLTSLACGLDADNSTAELLPYMQSDDAGDRARAAEYLGNKNDPAAVSPLIEALEDPAETVQIAAVKSLGKLGDKRAFEPLLPVLGDQNKEMRIAVIGALGKLRDSRALEPLLALLKENDPDIRWETAAALGELQDPGAVIYLAALLDDYAKSPLRDRIQGEDPTVVSRARASLLQIGAPAIEPLTAYLRQRIVEGTPPQDVVNVLAKISGSEPYVIAVFNEYGSENLARAMLNCDNPQLEAAAEQWAKANGYEITKMWEPTASRQ